MIFEPEIEMMERNALEEVQSARLREMVSRVYESVPYMRDRLQGVGIEPSDITGIADLWKLPFTRKTDLRDTYPFGLFTKDKSNLLRIHASSGTTGKPTVVGYTAGDLDIFGKVCARALAGGGAEPGMLLHNAYGYGLFTGGLGIHQGGETLGMVVVPASTGMTERQVRLIMDFGTEVLCCTPSYALHHFYFRLKYHLRTPYSILVKLLETLYLPSISVRSSYMLLSRQRDFPSHR